MLTTAERVHLLVFMLFIGTHYYFCKSNLINWINESYVLFNCRKILLSVITTNSINSIRQCNCCECPPGFVHFRQHFPLTSSEIKSLSCSQAVRSRVSLAFTLRLRLLLLILTILIAIRSTWSSATVSSNCIYFSIRSQSDCQFISFLYHFWPPWPLAFLQV